MDGKKCDVTGCKHPAKWLARKLFGDRGMLVLCDEHKPDRAKRSAALKDAPFFYEVEALPGAK